MSNADGFDNHNVEARRFAQQPQLSCMQTGSTQMPAGGGRTDEGGIRSRQFGHPRFVAKDAATADRTAGVDGNHRHAQSVADQSRTESLQKGAFPGPRRTCDPQTQRVAGERHYGIQQLCAQRLVTRVLTFNQRHGLGERRPLGLA